MSPELSELPPPPEGGTGMRAADLINKVCVFRPNNLGEWDAKPAEVDADGNVTKEAQKASTYVECDVWVLDRAGILEEGSHVRVSWWKAVDQLKGCIGEFVPGKPTQEQGGRAVFLHPLEGDALKIAAKVVAELDISPEAEFLGESTEPF